MIDIEMQWCKEFVEGLNGRAPSAAELYDFLDRNIKSVEEAMDEGYLRGYDEGYSVGYSDGESDGYTNASNKDWE